MKATSLFIVLLLSLAGPQAMSQIELSGTIPKDDYTVRRQEGRKFTVTGGDLSTSQAVDIVPFLVVTNDSTFSFRLNVTYRGEDWVQLSNIGGLELSMGGALVRLNGMKPLRFVRGYHSVTEQVEFVIDRRDFERFVTTQDVGARLVLDKGSLRLNLSSDAVPTLREFLNQYGGKLRDNKEIHYTGRY
jgi:hypothetical protein